MAVQEIRRHTARKRHECDKCGKPIEPGTEYTRICEYGGEDFAVIKLHGTAGEACPTKRRGRTRRPTMPNQGW